MSKIIAVHGATGVQGGSVVAALLKSDWKVRAITRNPSGDAAKALDAAGIEVVAANFDDEASLIKAYEGVEAIFLVTNFWEHLFTGKDAVESGKAEATQALTVAKVADKVPTLKHFIWSTLPGNADGQAKRTAVKHLDFKAQVDVTIRKEYPRLAAKTTYLYVGYYATNLAFFPLTRLFTTAATFGGYVWVLPVSRKTVLPSAGDVRVNVGLFAKAILEQPAKSQGRYAAVVADTPTHEDVLGYWVEITGKRASILHVSGDDYINAFGGAAAEELYLNLKVFEENSKAMSDNNPLSAKDLGIEEKLVGTKATLESLKDQLL